MGATGVAPIFHYTFQSGDFTMKTIAALLLVVTSVPVLRADEAADNAKKQADQVSQATVKGDYAKVADFTFSGLIEFFGGRERMISATEAIMKTLKSQGFEMTSNKVSDPGEIVKEDGKSYIIVPTLAEMKAPQGKMRIKGYLLGISSDDGKNWKFLDGAGLGNKELKDKILPNLPAKVKLPAPVAPEITKD